MLQQSHTGMPRGLYRFREESNKKYFLHGVKCDVQFVSQTCLGCPRFTEEECYKLISTLPLI